MARLSSLPTEVLQQIGSYLSLDAKYTFYMTHKNAAKAFHNNLVEYNYVWDKIFKNQSWLNKMVSKGFDIAIVGYDMRFLHQAARKNDMLVALVPMGPRGSSYRANQQDLLCTLRCDCFNKYTNLIHFSGFQLYIGSVLHLWPNTVSRPYRLLHPEVDRTLVTYFNDHPIAVHYIKAQLGADGSIMVINDEERNKELGVFLDI